MGPAISCSAQASRYTCGTDVRVYRGGGRKTLAKNLRGRLSLAKALALCFALDPGNVCRFHWRARYGAALSETSRTCPVQVRRRLPGQRMASVDRTPRKTETAKVSGSAKLGCCHPIGDEGVWPGRNRFTAFRWPGARCQPLARYDGPPMLHWPASLAGNASRVPKHACPRRPPPNTNWLP